MISLNLMIAIKKQIKGFTIVEVLIVIVVIGILAIVVTVSYRGVVQSAIELSLTNDLSNASDRLKIFQSDHGKYPLTINCDIPDSDTNVCVKFSDKNSLAEYKVDNTLPISKQNYQLSATHSNNVTYRVNNKSTPIPCPLGFIVVPGSKKYGTSDFCVMKYEAKQVGSTDVPVSKAEGLPWVEIRKVHAVENSNKVTDCKGCHLISESEWLTIAQDILMNTENWSGGAVGNGFIYGGHVFNDPANSLAASSSDDDIYFGMGTEGSMGRKRTLKLSNGEVIWDFTGNVREWTSGTVSSGFPGVDGGGATWRDWSALTNLGSLPDPNPAPSYAYSASAT